VHADLLGALCGAASVGLRREKTLRLDSLPRLATFFHWGSACEPALWRPGEFHRAFAANAEDATEDVIEAEQAAAVFHRFMIERGKEWAGTATQLLAELLAFVRRPVREAEAAHAKAPKEEKEIPLARLREARETVRDILGDRWPKAPNALIGKLKRASPALRNVGIQVDWPTRHGEVKIIKVTMAESKSSGRGSSQSSDRPAQPRDSANSDGSGQRSRDDPASSGDDPVSFGDDHDWDDLDEGGTIAGRSTLGASSRSTLLNSKNNSASKMKQADRDDVSRPIWDGDRDLIERIVSYVADYNMVAALPDRLFDVMGQQPLADEAAMIVRLKEIEGALAERGIAMMFEEGGHVVLEHCQPRPPQVVSPLDAAGNSHSDAFKSVRTSTPPNGSKCTQNPQKSANPNGLTDEKPVSLEGDI
jgi:hypothetical protein